MVSLCPSLHLSVCNSIRVFLLLLLLFLKWRLAHYRLEQKVRGLRRTVAQVGSLFTTCSTWLRDRDQAREMLQQGEGAVAPIADFE